MIGSDEPTRTFIAFDLETTGLLPDTDRIVEIGAVRFTADGREIEQFQTLVNPTRMMSPAARAVHGISDEDVAGAPLVGEVLPGFLEFLGHSERNALIAHNAVFDAGFLGRELARAGMPFPGHRIIDTLALARRVQPGLPTHRLETLCHFHGIQGDRAHRALADALRVKELFLRLGGTSEDSSGLVCYGFHDPRIAVKPPRGWEGLEEAIARGNAVRITYEGGSRGATPREITPRRFAHKGGTMYVVAYCHLDRFEKSFRLDRIKACEVAGAGS